MHFSRINAAHEQLSVIAEPKWPRFASVALLGATCATTWIALARLIGLFAA